MQKPLKKIDELANLLTHYDVISFDIFDTLITRCTPEPSDVFQIVESILSQKPGWSFPFADIRKKAETKANSSKVYPSFDEIYEEIRELSHLSEEKIEEIKLLEYKTELDLLVARKDILNLFNALTEQGKRIILISDMYFSSKQLLEILTNCGYKLNGVELIVSNEIRKSKQDGTLWAELLNRKGPSKWIHIGDNLVGDVRFPNSHGFDVLESKFRIFSPLEQFLDHSLSKKLGKYLNGSIAEKLILGKIIGFSVFNNVFFELNQNTIGAWLGPVLAAFIDFVLEKSKDISDSFLLFVTREGYILRPLFLEYSKTLRADTPPNCLFFASRVSTSLASLESIHDIEVLAETPFSGNVEDFIEKKLGLNFKDGENKKIYSLPSEKTSFLKAIKPYLGKILVEAKNQRNLYIEYCQQNFSNANPVLIDIGFTGRTQYNLSRILSRKVAGFYLMLEKRNLPKTIDCVAESFLHLPNVIYENLPFFESSLQVRKQSVLSLEKREECIFPCFAKNPLISPLVQEHFDSVVEFVCFQAKWRRELGDSFKIKEAFIEEVWMAILAAHLLPPSYLKALMLEDDFSGLGLIEVSKQKINSQGFSILFYKTKLKNLVKEHIPLFAYNFARELWIRYFK